MSQDCATDIMLEHFGVHDRAWSLKKRASPITLRFSRVLIPSVNMNPECLILPAHIESALHELESDRAS